MWPNTTLEGTPPASGACRFPVAFGAGRPLSYYKGFPTKRKRFEVFVSAFLFNP